MKHKKSVLILGCQGMTGRVVFLYLKKRYSYIYGTSRTEHDQKNVFKLSVENFEKDIKTIFKKTGKTSYIINCIGILSNSSPRNELVQINSVFPHNLSQVAKQFGSRIIHISTDAVFSPKSKVVLESSGISPIDAYGASKFLGELNYPHAITIRTSLLGLDPLGHKGILEWVVQNSSKNLSGFTNQIWSGCTTLQFAKFCEVLCFETFEKVRSQNNVIHFAPIQNATKYEIVSKFNKIIRGKGKVKKTKGTPISRRLKTRYSSIIKTFSYRTNLEKSLRELIKFEHDIISK